MIDWLSKNDVILSSKTFDQSFLNTNEGLFWIQTSGSSGVPKWVGLSKEGVLTAAQSVNQWIGADASDRWCNWLCTNHIGGFAIVARSYLSKSIVNNFSSEKWSAKKYVNSIADTNSTLSSLVPTQLFDIVDQNLAAPPSIRQLFIGGGFLPHAIFTKAVNLGWPVLCTFGMTEASSQIATMKPGCDERSLHLLNHIECQSGNDNRLFVRGPSVVKKFATFDGKWTFTDPVSESWFATSDRASIENRIITPLGRLDDRIKCSGHLIDLMDLNKKIWNQFPNFQNSIGIVAIPDDRLENRIILVKETKVTEDVMDFAQTNVWPLSSHLLTEHLVKKIPKSSLGKWLKADLLKTLD